MIRFVLTVLMVLYPRMGAAQEAETAQISVPKNIEESALANPEAFEKRNTKLLFKFAPDGQFTPAMAEIVLELEKASARQSALGRLLKYDLDGNGEVSGEEVRRMQDGLTGRERARLENDLTRVDTNADGAFSREEIEVSIEDRLSNRKPNRDIERLLDLDVNGDQVTTLEDIKSVVAMVEGTTEAQANLARRALRRGDCELPAPSETAEVVLFSAYKGAKRSRVNVHGSSGVSSFVELVIETGETPLYLVLVVHDAMVVKLTGDTQRVEHVVAMSNRSIGVAGTVEDRVTFSYPRTCEIPLFYALDSADALQAKAGLSARLGRSVDALVGRYEAKTVALPSGETVAAPAVPEKSAITRMIDLFLGRGEMEGINTGKVGEVERDEIVTLGGLTLSGAYEHPEALVMLINSKHIRRMPDGAYAIEKPFDVFPGGIGPVTLILRDGIAMPKGNIGEATIIVEATGDCVGRCPRR